MSKLTEQEEAALAELLKKKEDFKTNNLTPLIEWIKQYLSGPGQMTADQCDAVAEVMSTKAYELVNLLKPFE